LSSSTTEPGAGGRTLVDVVMPHMGVSVAEGTVVEWKLQAGDLVHEDEALCVVSTDKIDTELPSPVAGRLQEIIVAAGDTVLVGATLARIAADGGAPPRETAPEEEQPSETADAQAPSSARLANGTPSPPSPEPSNGGLSRSHFSPVVLRIAQREGVDLSLVPGSGRGGRVRKQDVLAFLESRGGEHESGAPREAVLHTESPYREDDADVAVGQPLSRMRRSIAEHMLRSLATAAHCTSIIEADMSAIEAARAPVGLSALPFVARCVIGALRVHPQLNGTLEDDLLTAHREVHLGIAVSLEERGLIVPVIHDAQSLSPEGLAERIRDLAERARAGALSPDEVRGGTFTITNPGRFGTFASTPIINQPQIAILDLEAVIKRPVVVTDGAGRDSIAIRPMVNLCLSWDHRALDGALAAQFLSTVRQAIESFGA
jgi:pyruvate/2-oxoglutarate dehydrogenase complex dihydrolipoamide acyltransferase (E2) component